MSKQTCNTEVQKADTCSALNTKLSGELSADQAERDHAASMDAIRKSRIEVQMER